MESIVLVVIMVCGSIDTYIVKFPDQVATYTHDVKSYKVNETIIDILQKKPVVIQYEEDRGICA